MEVHHSHQSHHKKKWHEFVLEFFMLFVAVTMGFFAENLREHKVIEHKMEENYESLLQDLSQDSTKISKLFERREQAENNLVKLKYMLFQYHRKEIDVNTLKKEYLSLGILPTYSTLFINNTTFKNMQSSGLLSYIKHKELKSKLSFYYEVVFKRLEDNNELFDQAGVNFFQAEIPHRNNIEMTRMKKELLNGYPSAFSDNKQYAQYLMTLPISEKRLISDALVYAVDAYSSRYYDYFNILESISTRNKELKKLIQSIQH